MLPQKYQDYVGQKFNKLTIVEYAGQHKIEGSKKDKKEYPFVNCLCDCGNTKHIRIYEVVSGRVKSCGCAYKEAIKARTEDLIGKTFGYYTVIKYSYSKKSNSKRGGGGVYWECRCVCGETKIVRGDQLKSGDSKSCGCMQRHLAAKKIRKFEPRIASARQTFAGNYNDGNLTVDEFIELSQQDCFYCTAKPQNLCNVFKVKKSALAESIEQGDFIYNGLDRVDPKKPHNKDNVVTCCIDCNSAKMDMSPKEFQTWLKRASAHHLYGMTPDQLDEAVVLWKVQNEKASRLL
jgi:hypothetical protein